MLKPGGRFAGYDWVVTKKYDPNNKDHVRIKEGIEVGNGLPTLATPEHIVECLEKAGFEVEDHYDANQNVHAANEIPWYDTLNGKMSVSGFRMTYVGRLVTHSMVWTLETLGIAPRVRSQFLNSIRTVLIFIVSYWSGLNSCVRPSKRNR